MAVFCSYSSFDLLVLLGGVIFLLYVIFTRHYNYWMKIGAPHILPTVFRTNIIPLLRYGMPGRLKQLYREHEGLDFVGVFLYDRPILLMRDPGLVRTVLVDDSDVFAGRSVDLEESRDLKALLVPETWWSTREVLNSTFSPDGLEMAFLRLRRCGHDIIERLHGLAASGEFLQGEVFEVRDLTIRHTIDVLSSCAFGIQAESFQEPEGPLARLLRRYLEPNTWESFKIKIRSFSPSLCHLFWSDPLETLKTHIRLIITDQKSGRRPSECILSYNVSSGGDWKELLPSALVFLSAGFKTSSGVISLAIYELSRQPQLQARLRNDIRAALSRNGGELTYEVLQRIKYLDMLVSETLRKYPLVPCLERRSVRDYVIPGSDVTLKKGCSIVISLLGIHHDPQYYPEPGVFNPERFGDSLRVQSAFLPFGDGPRKCLGKSFGTLVVKSALAHLFQKYEFRPCQEHKIPLTATRENIYLTVHAVEDAPYYSRDAPCASALDWRARETDP
uniref:(California timema) hypothetical protein n=1 Tax=Timema californicum TaxID=61474 RepID=A0A7R9IY96_TIMCA|nr:unnamed protein product [Timema californicum]